MASLEVLEWVLNPNCCPSFLAEVGWKWDFVQKQYAFSLPLGHFFSFITYRLV